MKGKNTDTKKPKARDAFKEFAEKFYGKPLGDLNDQQRTHGLTRFYISEIYNSLYWSISDDDFDTAVTDGPKDLDVDFVHRDDNRVLILQVRYHTEGKNVDPQDIGWFQKIFERLLDPKFKKNPKISDAVASIDFARDNFFLRYITLGKLTGQAEIQAGKGPYIPEDMPDLADRVTFECFDEPRLNEELRGAYSIVTGVTEEAWDLVAAKENGKRTRVIEIPAGGYRSCVMVVSAEQIVNLYKRFKDALFTVNIRNYIGSTATNKGIIQVARDSSDRFFFCTAPPTFGQVVSCF